MDNNVPIITFVFTVYIQENCWLWSPSD